MSMLYNTSIHAHETPTNGTMSIEDILLSLLEEEVRSGSPEGVAEVTRLVGLVLSASYDTQRDYTEEQPDELNRDTIAMLNTAADKLLGSPEYMNLASINTEVFERACCYSRSVHDRNKPS